MMRWLLAFLLSIALGAVAAHAATFYCGPSATGAGTGANFSNLLALPNTTGFARGDVYVCVEGSYGGRALSTATSGTSTITIRAVDPAVDSGVTGYSAGIHDGQVVFGNVNIKTQYWIIDGIRRTVTDAWSAPTGYGMRIDEVTADSLNGDDADFSVVRYADIGDTYAESPSSGTINGYGVPIRLVYNQTDITFSYCAIHNGKGTLLQGAGADNLTFEHCDIGPGWGKEALRGGNGSVSSGWIIRYNRFWNSTQTDPNDGTSGITAEIGIWDWTGTATGHAIYGNVFFNDKSGGRNAAIVVGGNGSSWAGGGADGTVVYNNTFAGMPESGVFGMVDLNGSSTAARNNLFWDTAGTSISASTTSNNVDAGSDPFVDYASEDFRLSGATSAGFSLSSPYNADRLGSTRGADGTWDVGAYEYVSGGDTTPPTVTSIVVPTTGDSVTVNLDEATIRAGGTPTVTLSGVTLTYSSGSGTTALVFTPSRTIYSEATEGAATVSCTLTSDQWEDAAGNDVVSWGPVSITNNSTQEPESTPGATFNSLTVGP